MIRTRGTSDPALRDLVLDVPAVYGSPAQQQARCDARVVAGAVGFGSDLLRHTIHEVRVSSITTKRSRGSPQENAPSSTVPTATRSTSATLTWPPASR